MLASGIIPHINQTVKRENNSSFLSPAKGQLLNYVLYKHIAGVLCLLPGKKKKKATDLKKQQDLLNWCAHSSLLNESGQQERT